MLWVFGTLGEPFEKEEKNCSAKRDDGPSTQTDDRIGDTSARDDSDDRARRVGSDWLAPYTAHPSHTENCELKLKMNNMAASGRDVYGNSDVSEYSLLSEIDTSLRSTSSGCEFADVSADASQLSGGEARGEREDTHSTSASGLSVTISDKNAQQIAEQVAAASPSRRRRPHSARTCKKKKQDLKACMLSMKGQVAFLHQMMQKIAVAEKDSFLLGPRSGDHHHTGDLSGMSFSSLSPVRKSSTDVIALPDAHFKKQMLFQDNWELDHDDSSEPMRPRDSSSTESAVSRIAELERENTVLKEQIAQNGKHTNDAVTELLDEIEDLKRRASMAEEENAHLQSVVLQFEQIQSSRVQDDVAAADSSASTASDSFHVDNNNQTEHEELHTIQEANDSDFAVVTQEEPANLIHVNHERCQVKIHELWQTIKNLKVYVEMYRIEKDDLKTQRDEAVASAERAWKDNAKLAGNTNPQQKIKYLQAVKNENTVLLKKIRELQSRLAALQAKKAVKKANGMFEPQDSSQSDLSSFDESILECAEEEDRDDSEPERSKLFRKMWHHNKELEAEILRLREQKRALVTRRSRSESTESSGSGPSSSRSNNSKKSFVTMRGKPSRHLPSVA